MKKIITEKKPEIEEVFYLEDIKDDMIIGALYQMDRKLGIINTKTGFIGLNANTVDISSNFTKSTIQEYIKELGVQNTFFIFKTPKELYKWLSE